MKYLALLVFTFAISFCSAESPFETWTEGISRHWKVQRSAYKDTKVKLYIALSNPREASFEKRALEIATPGSLHYRKHMSSNEMDVWMKPSTSSVEKIRQWLKMYKIESFLDHDVVVAHDAPLSHVESLLKTRYKVFQNERTGEEAVRTTQYFVPKHLQGLVDFISPTVQFPVIKPIHKPQKSRIFRSEKRTFSKAQESVSKACKPGVKSNQGPECIRALYNIGNYTAKNSKTAFGIHAPSSSFDKDCLNAYLKKFNPPAYEAGATFDIIAPVNNTVAGRAPDIDVEANLDTQISFGLAYPAKAFFYLNIADGSFNTGKPPKGSPDYKRLLRIEDEFFTFLHGLVYNKTGASVVSESDGSNEELVSPSIARRYCRMFAQIGAKGITYLWATGDNGAQGYQDGVPRSTVMAPTFPGSCPWVTGVGATANVFNESAATQQTSVFASSGGFSNYFARPSYQDTAVSRYIKKSIDPLRSRYEKLSGFNISGRAIPDISAIGFHAAFVPDRKYTVESGAGTSAASPAWAAFVALLNDHEFNRGCPPLGFLNPWLYGLKTGQGIKDIVFGGPNDGLSGYYPDPPVPTNAPHFGGYETTEGYDPVTGLGSLDFVNLAANIPPC